MGERVGASMRWQSITCRRPACCRLRRLDYFLQFGVCATRRELIGLVFIQLAAQVGVVIEGRKAHGRVLENVSLNRNQAILNTKHPFSNVVILQP